jgi:two-component system phosphate regulon response regulator PhoB
VSHALTFADFGPGSIDGWVTGLVAKELGLDAGGVLDATSHEMVIDGRRKHLTPLEFEFVRYLVSHEGAAVSRANLMEAVWGYEFAGESNVVDTLVAGLRRKLRHDAAMIETVWGVGYRFKQD